MADWHCLIGSTAVAVACCIALQGDVSRSHRTSLAEPQPAALEGASALWCVLGQSSISSLSGDSYSLPSSCVVEALLLAWLSFELYLS